MGIPQLICRGRFPCTWSWRTLRGGSDIANTFTFIHFVHEEEGLKETSVLKDNGPLPISESPMATCCLQYDSDIVRL